VLETRPDIAWLEVHTENHMGGGKPIAYLEAIRAHYPISLHGVGLSLGSAEGLDAAHLERIRQTDLLPLPMTEEALDIVCRHVDQTQAYLRWRILVENPSTYLRWRHSTIPEWEFLSAVASRTGCGILCDVNNIYVSAANHDWDTSTYLAVAARRDRRDPSRRTFRSQARGRARIADRRPRLARDPGGLDALRRGARALRPVPTLIE
jgi:uncharacterized protein (UPF0276 family)